MYPVLPNKNLVLPNKKTKKKDGNKKDKNEKERNEKSNFYNTKSFFPFPDLLMFYHSLLKAPD